MADVTYVAPGWRSADFPECTRFAAEHLALSEFGATIVRLSKYMSHDQMRAWFEAALSAIADKEGD